MELIIPATLFKNFNSIRNLMIRAIGYNKSARFRCNRKLVNASTLEKYRRWKTVVTGGYIFFISGKIILVVSVACNFLGTSRAKGGRDLGTLHINLHIDVYTRSVAIVRRIGDK